MSNEFNLDFQKMGILPVVEYFSMNGEFEIMPLTLFATFFHKRHNFGNAQFLEVPGKELSMTYKI